MNNSVSKNIKIILSVLLLIVICYIIFGKIMNKNQIENDQLIEKIIEEHSDYKFVDIEIYNKQYIDYEYSDLDFNINFNSSDKDFIDISFEVQNNKLIYNYENKHYESTIFNNVKKVTRIVDSTTGPQCMIMLLTTDGNLYRSVHDCDIEEKIKIEQLITDIDKSFEKIDLQEFKVEDFKITYPSISPIVIAIDSNNEKKLLTCSREYGCKILTKELEFTKTIGMGQDSYTINKDGSINIGVIEEQIKYNNITLKIQSIFEDVEYINDRFTYYVVDKNGYLYKIELTFDDKDEEYYNIYKVSELPVKKIGYKKLNNENISLIFLCEDGTMVTSTTQANSMYDVNNKIGN